jgi:hypothetical protein
MRLIAASHPLSARGRVALLAAIGPVLALSIAASPGLPRQDFESRRIYPAGRQPVFVTIGDIDEDQIPDAVIADAQDNAIRVVFSNGGLDLDNPVLAPLGVRPRSVAVVDLNHDGHPDLVVASDSPGGLVTAVSAGNVTFRTARSFAAGGRCDFLVIADFNQDGKSDVALTNPLADSITWLAGDGTGGFGSPATLRPGSAPEGIATADFNLDGHADIAATLGTGEVAVLLGDGSGGFGVPRAWPAGAGAEGILAADLNGDGKVDLAVANRIDRSLSVLDGLGDGTFGTTMTIALSYEAAAVSAADLDEDGRPDLLLAGDPAAGTILVLRRLAGGGYDAPDAFQSGAWSRDIGVADFNRDGHQDAAVVNTGGNEVALMFGNGSGRLRSENRLLLPLDAVTDLDAADFNEDGFPNIVATNVGPIVFPACGAPLAMPGDGPLDCGFDLGLMRLTMFRGIGRGFFAQPLSLNTHCMPIASLSGDFNGDGHADVLVVNQGYRDAGGICVPASLSLFAGQGNGFLDLARDLLVNEKPVSAAAGDFDGDGRADAVVGFEDAGKVRIYHVDGLGNLAAIGEMAAPAPLRSMTVADLDRDGHQDMAGTEPNLNKVLVLRGDGRGHLTVAASCGSGNSDPRQIVAGDFTGDGRLDLAVATAGSAGAPASTVTVLPQSSGSTFCVSGTTITRDVGLRPIGLAVADFNRDGVDDFVAGDGTVNMATPRSGNPSIAGPFDTYGLLGGGKMISRDLDGNGTPDLAAISNPGAVSIVLNATPVAPHLLLWLEGSLVSWTGVAGATSYDVVRGDLAALRAGQGEFGAAAQACVANNQPLTSVRVEKLPASGEGIWILARSNTPAGPGTYDSGGPGQVAPRDPMLRSSPPACP